MPQAPREELNCETDGVMTTLAGIAGSLQAKEVIKSIINSNNKSEGRIMLFNALNTNFRKVKLLKNPKCKNINLHE